MPERKLGIRRAAVLGAGVMGAQIAAHFTAAGIPVYLFDLPSDNADRSKLARQGIQRLLKLKPAPLVDARLAGLITPMNFADDLKQLCQRSEEHTSELQSRGHLVCRLLLEKKK